VYLYNGTPYIFLDSLNWEGDRSKNNFLIFFLKKKLNKKKFFKKKKIKKNFNQKLIKFLKKKRDRFVLKQNLNFFKKIYIYKTLS
jgi:hypothetical protein